jgi:hypothetical protein
MTTISFWGVFWLLLLLPVILVALGKRASVLRAARVGGGEQEGVNFARGLGILSSILPVVLMLLSILPVWASDNAFNILRLYVPILGALGGLCATVLYLLSGRGIERWAGSLASILAVGWLVLLVVAGWAAA